MPSDTSRWGGAGGRLDFGRYSFSEGHHPHCFITKLDPFGDLSAAEQNETLSHQKSLINTNQAYQLATNWLGLIGVDVRELEKTNKVEVRQRWFWGNGNPALKISLPIFEVRWGEWDHPKVEITVDGRTNEFLSIRMQEQGSFSRRPPELINDLDKLLAIPDEEFLKYSPAERSNLVVRFSAPSRSASTNGTSGVTPSTKVGQTFHVE